MSAATPDSFDSPDGRTYSDPVNAATPRPADPWQVIADVMSELIRGGQTADIRCRAALGVLERAGIDFDGNPVARAAQQPQPAAGDRELEWALASMAAERNQFRIALERIADNGVERISAAPQIARRALAASPRQPQPAPGIPLRSDAETAAMLRADLADAEAQLARWPRCPAGCNCRIGIDDDPDRNECGCDGPCNGGEQPAPGVDECECTHPGADHVGGRAKCYASREDATCCPCTQFGATTRPGLGTAWRLLDEARADRDLLRNALLTVGKMIPAVGGASAGECRKISEVVWAVVRDRDGQPQTSPAVLDAYKGDNRRLRNRLAALLDLFASSGKDYAARLSGAALAQQYRDAPLPVPDHLKHVKQLEEK